MAVTDYVKSVPDLVARWIPRDFTVLGTDGFGRSDTRAALRRLFEVDAEHIALAALSALVRTGELPAQRAADAIRELGLEPDAPDPLAT